MKRAFAIGTVALLVVGCGEKLHDGAIDIFARVNVCPANRLTITLLKDVPPHTILRTNVPAPPADVAADPERMKMWRDMHKVPDVDAFGRTYEVTGCGKTTRFVCAHPRVEDEAGPFSVTVLRGADGVNNVSVSSEEYYSSTGNAFILSGGVLESAVICLPEGTSITN